MGINLDTFLTDYQRCFQELLDHKDRYPTDIQLRDELVPKIAPPEEVTS